MEAGVFILRDPAGFVDGPNVYTYLNQNPWSAFDPDGLARIDAVDYKWVGEGHHPMPLKIVEKMGWKDQAKKVFDEAVLPAANHGDPTGIGVDDSREIGRKLGEESMVVF